MADTKINLSRMEVWFAAGSQHLYGEGPLKQVEEDAQKIAAELDASTEVPVRVISKPVLTRPEEITRLCMEADAAPNCVGLITWMHTFSPAKMWITGLSRLSKPFCHFHTQYNRDIPWSDIDMDFMNLNQSAHGGREFGFIASRLRKERKIIVGHWKDPAVRDRIGTWCRAAAAKHDAETGKIARFGDNMREVAVTEGDKVEAQLRFGYSVNGYALGDLVEHVAAVSDSSVRSLLSEYEDSYTLSPLLAEGGGKRESLRSAARIELGMRSFLETGGFNAFTTTFENLYGLDQLPGLAVQRLMAEGYGFGAEGDWKTAALVRALKVMAAGLTGGTSFMEDYTYHLNPEGMAVLGAHMLEICPSISAEKPSLDIYPLSIGGKDDPVRLIFNTATGPGVNASVIDMGKRFRMLVNPVQAIKPEEDLPNLPVARVLWKPEPELQTAPAACDVD